MATATPVSPPSYPSLEDFARIGHAYFALLFAWAGFALGGYFFRRFQVAADGEASSPIG